MRRYYVIVLIVAGIAMAAGSCNSQKGEGGNYDSLFLGISLGMQRKAFYDHCWDYNQKGLFIHSPTNQMVQYQIKELNSPVAMRFYPTFYQDKIFEMPVTFEYEAWAPWNRAYKSDSLINKLVPLFEKWYGPFEVTDHPQMGRVWYRIDGKRRINLYIRDDEFVRAVYTDLKVENELNKKAEEEAQK
jgi:hypothetical protein